jgi:hypothetical protein
MLVNADTMVAVAAKPQMLANPFLALALEFTDAIPQLSSDAFAPLTKSRLAAGTVPLVRQF